MPANNSLLRILDIPIYYRSPESKPDRRSGRWFFYNEMVGWIWLEPRQNIVRAEYCFVRQRPSWALVRREFEPRGKLFQVDCRRLSNTQIFERLSRAVEEIQTRGHLCRFWLDLTVFNVTGPAIDWRALLEHRLAHAGTGLKHV